MAGGGGGGKGAKGGAALNINLTPMIDCTMLLVIFFLLTTEIASSNFTALDLPKPTNPIAKPLDTANRVVINVLPYSDAEIAKMPAGRQEAARHEAARYDMEPYRYTRETLGKLKGDLATAAAGKNCSLADLTLVIRSDAKIDYTSVEFIISIAQTTGIKKVQLATWIDKKGGE
ncbi:MAG: biopolymer transporter ExbD [Planctomycetota bacterium]|nr:biopolymer transporter ExbD [Planctomycetota bacterium]